MTGDLFIGQGCLWCSIHRPMTAQAVEGPPEGPTLSMEAGSGRRPVAVQLVGGCPLARIVRMFVGVRGVF